MKKVLPYLGAALSTLAIALSAPAQAQSFNDVPADHWAYQAVSELQSKGILLGYPDGFFKGRRYLTRYEFAIAIKRALDKIGGGGKDGKDGANGKDGADGAPGAAGKDGAPGMTPEEVATLRRLTDEFKADLAAHGANIREINNRLDAIAKDVAAIKDAWSKAPKWGIEAFAGLRSDHSRFAYADKGGAGRLGLAFGSSVEVLHDLHLKPSAKLGNDISFTGDIAISNYFGYRGGTFSQASNALNPLLGPVVTAETITPYQAQLDIPVNGFGQETKLTVGRYKQHLTSLTYMRPDLDPYFSIASYDDGNYVQDGFRLSSKFGSLKTTLFAGSFATATSNIGLAFNRPLVGGGVLGPGANGFGGKPFGINAAGNQLAATQTLGLHFGVPLGNFADLGLTAVVFNTGNTAGANAALPYNTVNVYGANLKLKDIGRLTVNAEVAKAVTGVSLSGGDGQSNDDNNAYRLNLGYATGPVSVAAGYNYIDPRYGAPGSWLQIGNWYNPTNVQGPYLKLGYKINDSLNVRLSGDMLEGARNRNNPAGVGVARIGGLGTSDRINRVKAGLEYKVNSRLSASLDYEGVQYNLSAGSSASGVGSAPIEQYITFGAGLQLNASAKLRFGYQLINSQNIGGGFGAGAGIAGTGGGGTTSNASVFTTSLAVKF